MRLTTVLSVAALGAATFVGASPALAQRHAATTTQVVTDIIVPRSFDETGDGRLNEEEQRAQEREILKRRDLWSVYEGVGRGNGDCDIRNAQEIADTGGEGERARVTVARCTFQIPVPAGRRTEMVQVARFTDQSKYESWRKCHVNSPNRRAAGVRCETRPNKNAEGLYETDLQELRFVAAAGVPGTPPPGGTPTGTPATPPAVTPPTPPPATPATPPPGRTTPTQPQKKSSGCSTTDDGYGALWLPMAMILAGIGISWRRRSA